jgi:hypothetical protein
VTVRFCVFPSVVALAQLRQLKGTELEGVRRSLAQCIDQWSLLKTKAGWVASQSEGTDGDAGVAVDGDVDGADGGDTTIAPGSTTGGSEPLPPGGRAARPAPSQQLVQLMNHWKPVNETRYRKEFLDYCHQAGLNSQGYLRKQPTRPGGLRLTQKARAALLCSALL